MERHTNQTPTVIQCEQTCPKPLLMMMSGKEMRRPLNDQSSFLLQVSYDMEAALVVRFLLEFDS
jgi:hypothetical protein